MSNKNVKILNNSSSDSENLKSIRLVVFAVSEEYIGHSITILIEAFISKYRLKISNLLPPAISIVLDFKYVSQQH
jgi:hypothetical protein